MNCCHLMNMNQEPSTIKDLFITYLQEILSKSEDTMNLCYNLLNNE